MGDRAPPDDAAERFRLAGALPSVPCSIRDFQEARMIRKANAVWNGDGRSGTGRLTSASGVLSDSKYGFRTRFENEPGTNPEELLAAAHAGCFTMALAFALQAEGFTAEEIRTEAAVSLDADGPGFKISRSALTLRAKIPGIDEAKFTALAKGAEQNCPLSKALNAEITLDAKLES
jgi:osmotically inducible protein OsmC